jgi:hypothetical protein
MSRKSEIVLSFITDLFPVIQLKLNKNSTTGNAFTFQQHYTVFEVVIKQLSLSSV